ncbi:unnamed protein product [Prunus brigantina]
MAFNTKLLLAICCVALVFTLVSANISKEEIDGFVEEHNKARKEVGNKPLKWNTTLAQYAQEYADKRVGDCAMEHSKGRWGENLASGDGMSGAAATKYWVTEKELYNEKSNKCLKSKDECGHYLAVVWGKTTEVGCGISKCKDGKNYVVCSYDPIPNKEPHQDLIDEHNRARAKVGVGSIKWNDTVIAYAQKYADSKIETCEMVHSQGPYGENLAEGCGEMTGGQAVKFWPKGQLVFVSVFSIQFSSVFRFSGPDADPLFWVTEKPNYDNASNTCVGDVCGHYNF